MKIILGRHRVLVNDAVRQNKSEFLAALGAQQRRVIWDLLELRPERFWQLAQHGELLGENGIHAFVKRLKERTEGYEFEFPSP